MSKKRKQPKSVIVIEDNNNEPPKKKQRNQKPPPSESYSLDLCNCSETRPWQQPELAGVIWADGRKDELVIIRDYHRESRRFHEFSLLFYLNCANCKKRCTSERCDTKDSARRLVQNSLNLQTNPYGREIHFPSQFLELTLCSTVLPTEILFIITNWWWMILLDEMITHIEKIPITNSNVNIMVSGIYLPPVPHVPDMSFIMSGCSLGPYSRTSSSLMQMNIMLTGEFFISGIRVDKRLVKRNVTFQLPNMSPTHKLMASIVRKKDGLYVGELCLLKCQPNDSVSIDHIFSKNGFNGGTDMGLVLNFFKNL